MIQRLLFRLFGLEERPNYSEVKALSVPKKIEPPTEADVEKLLEYLQKKHMVDSISVFTEDGVLVATTLPEDEAVHEYSIFEQVALELSNVSHVFISKGDWIIAFRRGAHVYIVHAPAYVNMVELSAIARDVERMLFSMGW
ncbi:MAG TPA: hypothetical protein EYH23_00110 [Euryarchaeota archaeon]|nr:hypothetical protein [Euryarchaeota archaeon]HIQ09913.1 hypothetical protein [Euryarchaeota archaeon]